ncbi:hypothetical protein QBC39DRAFT_22176 [Podospora conica]|nr:hypothetical protein QBC39DRAFT_22176 [Schizothecium conicum]
MPDSRGERLTEYTHKARGQGLGAQHGYIRGTAMARFVVFAYCFRQPSAVQSRQLRRPRRVLFAQLRLVCPALSSRRHRSAAATATSPRSPIRRLFYIQPERHPAVAIAPSPSLCHRRRCRRTTTGPIVPPRHRRLVVCSKHNQKAHRRHSFVCWRAGSSFSFSISIRRRVARPSQPSPTEHCHRQRRRYCFQHTPLALRGTRRWPRCFSFAATAPAIRSVRRVASPRPDSDNASSASSISDTAPFDSNVAAIDSNTCRTL